MKIQVDCELGRSNAVYMHASPEVFEVRVDGILYVLQEDPLEALPKKVQRAVKGCPTGAIGLVE